MIYKVYMYKNKLFKGAVVYSNQIFFLFCQIMQIFTHSLLAIHPVVTGRKKKSGTLTQPRIYLYRPITRKRLGPSHTTLFQPINNDECNFSQSQFRVRGGGDETLHSSK